MSNLFKVSQSKVKLWRRCRQAYHYKYVEKLRKKRKSRPLVFGTLVHMMIEADANGHDPFDVLRSLDPKQMKLFAAEKAQYGELLQDVSDIMEEYFNHWEDSDLRYIRKAGKAAEHSFEIEIVPGILWNGKIDAIAKGGNGLRWLVEHKTFNRKPSDDDRWRNLQSVSYFRAMDILGWKPVDGTLWDYIWSKAPRRPALLKDGTLSKKSIDTLPVAVAAAIKEYALDPREYREYKRSVAANRKQWFQRIYTPVKPEVSKAVFSDFIASAVEMRELHGKVKEKNIERHCTWCDFEPLCRAQMQGNDFDYIKEREYETSDRPEQESDAHFVAYEDIEE